MPATRGKESAHPEGQDMLDPHDARESALLALVAGPELVILTDDGFGLVGV